MANVVFQGDIENFSESHFDLLRSIIKKNGLDNSVAQVETVGKKGDNYVAYVKRITVTNDDLKPFKMIVKIAPENENIRNVMNTYMMFKNEIVMYSEVLPTYSELFDEEDLASDQRFRIPTCYGYISEAPKEIIVLEDLQESNFGMLDRFKSLTDESVRLGLKDMAIFHSLSYVLKNKHPEKFNKIKHELLNYWALMDTIPHIKGWLSQLESDVVSILDSEKYKKVVEGTISQLTSHAAKRFKYDIDSKHSIIQQGDCWTNNILFRVQDNIPVESVMIDYQLSKIASPAADLHYFMFNCTDKDTRSKHYFEWMDYYYTELEKSLFNFGLKAAIIYPREQLDADLRSHGKLSLALTILLANVMVRESEDVMDVREGDTVSENQDVTEAADDFRIVNADEKTVARYRNRLQGCIDSFLEFGFIS